MDQLRISTMTAIAELNTPINHDNLYKTLDPSKDILYMEYGGESPKGESSKKVKKSRKNVKRKMFFNQMTLHLFHKKIVNVKLFNNGKIQMTGLKYIEQGEEVIRKLVDIIQGIQREGSPIFIAGGDTTYSNYQIVLINSDFDIFYQINRENLHREIVKAGIYSSYESCIYPGVNIKYFFNTNQSDGICCCDAMCTGKGNADGSGQCKKITIAVFMSGKIIITGGKNKEQLVIAHDFIKSFIDGKRELIELK